MDPSQISFFRLLSIVTKMVGPGASEIVLDLAAVALVGRSVDLHFLSHISRRWTHSILRSTPMRSR